MVIGAIVVLASPTFAASKSEEAKEKTVALSTVPQAAVNAATATIGSAPTEAKLITGTSPQQYELEAKKNGTGKEMAVHVQADGKVIKTETESEEHERGEH